jgi:hypothetical protein
LGLLERVIIGGLELTEKALSLFGTSEESEWDL